VKNNLPKLQEWYQSPLGQALLHAEKIGLDQVLPLIFGYYLLQMNGPSNPDFLNSCLIHTHITASPNIPNNPSDNFINCNFNELPFLPNSLDAVIIFHLLEFSDNPKTILNEVYNALIPGGTLIVFGFNPRSLWGLARKLNKNKSAPWNAKFISTWHLRRLLGDTGFNVGDYKTFYFRPPINNSNWAQRWLFLETLGQIFLPYCGGSYMYVAKKTYVGTHLIRPELYKTKLATNDNLLKPTTRSSE
jgi:SAM-dependent methyltransferase